MNTILIPAYNPSTPLYELTQQLLASNENLSIVLVDDGSTGSSKTLLDLLGTQPNITLLRHAHNQGKAQALRTGLRYIHRYRSPTTVVTADADGQHSPGDILSLANKARENPEALVLGCRQFSSDVPFRSRFGNQLTRVLFRWQSGIALSDTQTGLRAFSSQLIPRLLLIPGERYAYEMNMLLSLAGQVPFLEVPIETIYIDNNASSHFRPIRDGLAIYRQLFQFLLSSFASFLIDIFVFALATVGTILLPMPVRVFFSNGLARLTSALFNYSVNKRLVFHQEGSHVRAGLSYSLLALVIFILDSLCITFFFEVLSLPLLASKLLTSVLLFFLSWYVQKEWVFATRKVGAS